MLVVLLGALLVGCGSSSSGGSSGSSGGRNGANGLTGGHVVAHFNGKRAEQAGRWRADIDDLTRHLRVIGAIIHVVVIHPVADTAANSGEGQKN